MGREIKFRAYYKPEYTMLDWEFLQTELNHYSKPFVDTDDYKVMQYTGLKDKNGVEIYEGDRLEYQPNIDEDFTRDRYTVKWHNRGFVAAWDGDEDCSNPDNDGLIGGPKLDDMSVIGNIYETPELIKEPK